MNNILVDATLVVFMLGLAAYALFELWIHIRIKAEKTCDRCDHEVDLGKGDIMCGLGMGLEPLPYGNTCMRFKRKLK